MALTLLVVPGKTFAAGEKVTLEKLNQAATPTIQVLDDNITFVVADGSITVDHLADGCLTADDTGRAKVADGFLTAAKMAEAARNGSMQYGAATLAAGVYSVDLTPAATAYTAGMRVVFKADAPNTGAVDLNLNAIVASPNLLRGAAELAAGDILAGDLVEAIYDGTAFQVVSVSRGEFVSGEYLIDFGVVAQGGVLSASGGIIASVAHGLGAAPRFMRWVMKCVDAGGALGYAQNEEVDIANVWFYDVTPVYTVGAPGEGTVSVASTRPAFQTGASGTNVYIIGHEDINDAVAGTALVMLNKGTGARETINAGTALEKWRVKCYARL